MNFCLFYNSVEAQEKIAIDTVVGDLKLTCELKGNLQGLRCLANLPVNDFKTYWLYLAPIIFRPFHFTRRADSDLNDLNLLVQALSDLLEGSVKLEKCARMNGKFCQSMASKYLEGMFQSCNFHAFRHLTWQVNILESLSATSASTFESANHFFTRTFASKRKYCNILVTHFIRTLLLKSSDNQDDSLKIFTDNFIDCCSTEFTVDCGLKQNSDSRGVLEKHPKCLIYCTDRSCYTRNSKTCGGNGHVLFVALNENESGSLVMDPTPLFFGNGVEKFVYLELFYKHELLFLTEEQRMTVGYETAPNDRKKGVSFEFH